MIPTIRSQIRGLRVIYRLGFIGLLLSIIISCQAPFVLQYFEPTFSNYQGELDEKQIAIIAYGSFRIVSIEEIKQVNYRFYSQQVDGTVRQFRLIPGNYLIGYSSASPYYVDHRDSPYSRAIYRNASVHLRAGHKYQVFRGGYSWSQDSYSQIGIKDETTGEIIDSNILPKQTQ
jgi:hypothetical protein